MHTAAVVTQSANAAQILTAAASVLTALGLLITAFALLLPILRKANATHALVNQQHTDLLNYQAALIVALEASNITIPTDQSKGSG